MSRSFMACTSPDQIRWDRAWEKFIETQQMRFNPLGKQPMRDQLPAHYKTTAASNEEIQEWNKWRNEH